MTRSEALLTPLVGARIRRIDLPERDLVALTLSLEAREPDARDPEVQDETRSEGVPVARTTEVLLLSFAASAPAVGLVRERPPGPPASAQCRLLRKHLENAVLVGAEREGEALRLRARRGPERASLAIAAGVLVLEALGREHRLRAPEAGQSALPCAGAAASTLGALREAGQALLARRGARAEEADEGDLALRLVRLEKRLERRAVAVAGDLARTDELPELRARAGLILASLASIPRGAARVSLLDTSTDPPLEREIDLDPARTPGDQATALFDRARKLERGAVLARARLEETHARLADVRAAIDALGSDDAARGDMRERARALLEGLGDKPKRRTRGTREPAVVRMPYRRIEGHGGREIRVGRSARDNDVLTRDHAAPHDLWLHARGVRGAHVVVPLARGEVCPPELLVDAATLAAHFSDREGERVVEVDHLPRGRVRKRKGMPPGQVEVDHPKTIAVRVEPARLARLLKKPA
jgi:predicted ribosome quality control (RQC) complex YloA/Tae2 family protein